MCFRYNEDFEGVPLAYSGERVLRQTATVHPYFPLARLEVAAEVVVFRPAVGSRVGKLLHCVWAHDSCVLLPCLSALHDTWAALVAVLTRVRFPTFSPINRPNSMQSAW